MSAQDSNHAKGLALTAIGGMVLTFDIPLVKLASGETWSILMMRTLMTLIVGLGVWLVWRSVSGKAPPLLPKRGGLAVAALYGLSSIFFMIGVFNTSTANLVFILALNTMFAAILSWIFLGERPRPATFLAMAAMIVGVLIIVGGSLSSGNLLGDAAAFISTFFIACAITVTRASGEDMGFASLVGVALPLAVATIMVITQSDGQGGLFSAYSVDAPWWIIFNGAVVIPIAFFCLATGPKYLSGPEVAMFYLLETILAPIWVWIIFNETPTRTTLIGGAILLAALVSHSLWQLGENSRAARARLRRPA